MLLQYKVQGKVTFEQNMGWGFFLLKTNNMEVVRNMLLLTPFHSDFGLCLFQRWLPGFDPEEERGRTNGGSAMGMSIRFAPPMATESCRVVYKIP
jgi:hypothetical protein